MKITIHRIYDSNPAPSGYRVLVDRVWPRGIRKEEAALDEWLPDLGPSTELRQWFGHDPERWTTFQRRYRKELTSKQAILNRLREIAHLQGLVLLFGAKDREHNQAVALKAVLRSKPG